MHILLTNDDGINAPGLRAIRKQILEQTDWQLTVVAPASEQSAVSHSLTLYHPILVHQIVDDGTKVGYAVEGKPADCVKIALTHLLGEKPDLIISGINAGANAGINVLYSGTVAAVLEGAFFGVPGIAVSQALPVHDYHQSARDALNTIKQIIKIMPPRAGDVLNLNLPTHEHGPIKGIRVVPQGFDFDPDSYEARTDPRGRRYYWLRPDRFIKPTHQETDLGALAEGYISLTPLHFDWTDHPRLAMLSKTTWEFPLP